MAPIKSTDLKSRQVRVLLADRNTQVQWALRTVIHEQPGLCVVGQASNVKNLLDQAKALRPDLILLEWELSDQPASHILTALRSLELPCRVIVLGRQSDSRAAALRAGAEAFVSKSDPPEQFLQVLRGLA